MKLKTSMLKVNQNYNKIISIGYCDLESLLAYKEPFAYSAGLYGWSCDYYNIDGVIICTGYRTLNDKGVAFDYKIVKKYNSQAIGKNEEEKNKLLKAFIDECTEVKKQ